MALLYRLMVSRRNKFLIQWVAGVETSIAKETHFAPSLCIQRLPQDIDCAGGCCLNSFSFLATLELSRPFSRCGIEEL